ncbi:TonB-dependent receptor [Sphingomonas sp. Root710]|uniref:TonB-dependent receptor n=1 Tax=Sphingomonas sp. Root710 TaxID=1736594 RepID=UPI0009E8706C|nr:TonB-dependent receptor [Sphingomonas sp. Root710]
MISRKILLLTASAMVALPAGAYAQTAAAPQAAVDDADIGEIVVTAQRREQALSDVGMSISAIGGEALQTRNFNNVSDLSKLVPGLSVSDSGFSTPIYTLRGVGINEPSIGSSSSVAIYVDEVPLAYPVMTQGTALDLQRVEVLKGPQGTLYGQNSTGGAINYIANKPTDEFAAGISATLGRFMRGNVEGFVSGPLAPTLKARVAVRGSFGDGWQESLSRNDSLGKVRNYTARAILDWEPSDNFKVSFNANGWIDKSDTIAPQLVAVFPGNSFNVDRNLVVVDGANPASCSAPVGRLPGCPINALTGTRVTAANNPVITRPELLPGRNPRAADWDAGRDFDRDDSFWQGSVRAEWQLNDTIALTSITSYAKLKRDQTSEFDGTAVSENLANFQKGEIKSFAQEVRMTADFANIHWLVGANYGNDRTNDDVTQFLRNASAVQNIFGFPSNGGRILARQRIKNWAVFTSIDAELTDQLTLSGGIRLSEDTRKFRGCGAPIDAFSTPAYTALINTFRAGAGLPPIPQLVAGQCYAVYTTAAVQQQDTAGLPLLTPGFANRTLKEDNVPWNVNLNFKPTPSSLVYARVSRGYKAGNFSTLNTTDHVAYNPVVQEKLTAYELGGRFRLGRMFSFEAAAFRYDYIDKQLRARVFVGPPFGNINAQDTIPKSRLKGFEASATLRPIEGLTLSGSGTYIKSKILRYTGQTVDGILQDQAGSPFNFTPKYSLNGDINYEHPVSATLNGFIGLNVSYRSKTSAVFTPPNTPQPNLAPFKIDEYTLIDGQLGVEDADGRWKAFIWGKNIFNKYYSTNVVRVSDVIVRFAGMPATYGATVSYKF